MSVTVIAFLLIFFGGCTAALFIDTSYGILLYIFEYFLHPPGRWWSQNLPNLRYAFSIGIIIVISFLIQRKRYLGNRIFDVPQSKWLILFGIIIVLTWPIAVDQKEHEDFMVLFIKYILLFILIIKTIDTPQKFEKLIGVFLLGQFYLGWIVHDIGRTVEGRVEEMGTADARDANGLAAVMVVAVPYLIHYLIRGKKWQKLCSLPVIAFVLNALILINSRGAFLGILVSMSYYLLLVLKAPSYPKFNKAQVLVGITVGFLLFMYLADSIFWERMSTIIEQSEVTNRYTGRERIDFWFKTFDMLKDHPFGVGAMGYEKLSPQYLPPESLSSKTHTRAVHSIYFETMASYGYHGFLVFIVFLMSNFRYIWKLKRSLIQSNLYEPYHMVIAIEAAFVGHLISSVFVNRLYSEVLYWSSAFIASYGNIYFKRLNRSKYDETGSQQL